MGMPLRLNPRILRAVASSSASGFMDPGTSAGVTSDILARLLLNYSRYFEARITQVSGKGRGKLARNAVLLVALACAPLAFSGRPRAILDIAVRAESGHALFQIGAASIRIAFEFGQECPNSNACAGTLL